MAEATYFVGTTSSATVPNKHHLVLMNSAGSGRLMRIYRITASGAPTAAVTGLVVSLAAFRTSTQPTGGTLVTFYAAATGQGVVVAATGIGMLAPTNSLTLEQAPFGVGVVSGEETASANETQIYTFALTGMRPVELAPGSGVTIRQGVLAAASGAVNLVVYFTLV